MSRKRRIFAKLKAKRNSVRGKALHRKVLMVFAVDVVRKVTDRQMKNVQLVVKLATLAVARTILRGNVFFAEMDTQT